MSSYNSIGLSLATALMCAGAALAQTSSAISNKDDGFRPVRAFQVAPRHQDEKRPAKAGPIVSAAKSGADDDAHPRTTFMRFYKGPASLPRPPSADDHDDSPQRSQSAAEPIGAEPAVVSKPSDAGAGPSAAKSALVNPPTASDRGKPTRSTAAPDTVGAKPIASPATARPRSGKFNPLWAIPIETLRATRERPLFSASRRPPSPPVQVAAPVAVEAAAEPPPPERPQMKLVGVVHGAKQNMAIFVDQSGRSTVRLHVGDADSAGWNIKSVDLRAATLEKDSQTVTLELPARSDRSAATAGPPAAALASTDPD